MGKKIADYIQELIDAGKLKQGMLLTDAEIKRAITYFEQKPYEPKLSKKDEPISYSVVKDEPISYSVVRDESGSMFAIYNPDKEAGYGKGAESLIKIAQNIKTGDFILVKIQKSKEKAPAVFLEASRREKDLTEKRTGKRQILVGYQERIKHEASEQEQHVSYMFLAEMPGISLGTHKEAKPDDFFKLLEQNMIAALTDTDRLVILQHLLEALQELKECHIIHRDLHGGNIFIDMDAGFEINFIDFGLALYTDENGLVKAHPLNNVDKPEKTYGNGVDIFALKSAIIKLGLLIDKDLEESFKKLWKACGDFTKGYKSVDLKPYIENVKALIEAKQKLKPNKS